MNFNKLVFIFPLSLIASALIAADENNKPVIDVAKKLNWVKDQHTFCGGYYLEPPILPYTPLTNKQSVEITIHEGFLSQQGTSELEGGVTITRDDEQITADKAFLYRNAETGKLKKVTLIGDVHFREPDTLIVAHTAYYDLETKHKSLYDVFYRSVMSTKRTPAKKLPEQLKKQPRKIILQTAYGEAASAKQTKPLVYELQEGTYTTCAPEQPAWHIRAGHLKLDKNVGTGTAESVRLYIKTIPVFYFPYISFPLNKERKSGFTIPTMGHSKKWGNYIIVPYYLNLTPNYDMTVTAGFLSNRGEQIGDKFRYLTHSNYGTINFSVLPNDREFKTLKRQLAEKYQNDTSPVIQNELRRILQSNNTRKAFIWRDEGHYDEHWSSHLDFNYAGDDYYLSDFGSNLNEITQNQLLQEFDLSYKNEHWNFLGRLQSYQTLHPIIENESPIQNQYRRLPQLIFNGDYPNQLWGLNFFTHSDLTHFEILNTPGTELTMPVGERLHVQPGVSLPLQNSNYFFVPRLQLALTDYELTETADEFRKHYFRTIPIFDLASGLTLSRHMKWFDKPYKQTLEPQIYFTAIPYHKQSDLPVFDTTVNTLTYDQLFQYNRFSGLDRIGDTQQVSVGISSRYIDQFSGIEKIRIGLGEILYFKKRRVTLCNDDSCTDNPTNPELKKRYSPLSGMLKYTVNPAWQVRADIIWNPLTRQLDNSTVNFHYEPLPQRIFNVAYSYAQRGDSYSGAIVNTKGNHLRVMDMSFAFPVNERISVAGLWSQDFSQSHFQNLLFGLQYDTCCWAAQLGGGKAFSKLSPKNEPIYNSEFYLQFALKGLVNIGSGNPSKLLNNISGYNLQFGQET